MPALIILDAPVCRWDGEGIAEELGGVQVGFDPGGGHALSRIVGRLAPTHESFVRLPVSPGGVW